MPNFASVAASLHELTKKSRAHKWRESQENAFQTLKVLLYAATVLAYPVPAEKFILNSDTSGYGIRFALSQLGIGGEEVVVYYRRTLSKAERNYCVTRREQLAVLECIKHYHKYPRGQRFLLRTDYSALRWLLQFKNSERQLARWIDHLQTYDFSNLDCKHCVKAEKESVVDVRLTQIEDNEDWTEAQRSDPILAKTIAAKEEKK